MFSLYSKIPGFRLTYGGNPSDRFTRFEIGKESKATTTETYLTLELTEAHTRSSIDSCNEFTLEKVKGSEDFGKIIFHVENVTNFIRISNTMSTSLSLVYLKMNLLTLRGEKGSFIFVNPMAVNYRLHSHCIKNEFNNY